MHQKKTTRIDSVIRNAWTCWRASRKFYDYDPQPLTFAIALNWFKQHDKSHWRGLRRILNNVIYISEEETRRRLLSLNDTILRKLESDGVPITNVIYMSYDFAGSSSPLMLAKLRDWARLARKDCRFLDSKDIFAIRDTTNELKDGAIIYVDDFIGSGKQFLRSQKRVRQYMVGNFSEFLIAPCVCEEAMKALDEVGVVVSDEYVHYRKERPLLDECAYLDGPTRNSLVELSRRMYPEHGLGFRRLATMVVSYRDAPNSVPQILRGSENQDPYKGILPSTKDLPP